MTTHRVGVWMALLGVVTAGGVVAWAGIAGIARTSVGYDRSDTFFAALRDLAEEYRRAAELRDADNEMMRRVRLKYAVISDVREGRMSLWGAAVAFRRLLEQCPTQLDMVKHRYPGETTDECACRNVIDFVRAAGRADLGAGEELVRRLEDELAARLRECGGRLEVTETELE